MVSKMLSILTPNFSNPHNPRIKRTYVVVSSAAIPKCLVKASMMNSNVRIVSGCHPLLGLRTAKNFHRDGSSKSSVCDISRNVKALLYALSDCLVL